MQDSETSAAAKALGFCRERPVLVGLLLLGGVGGAVGAVYIAPQDLSLVRRVVGGALAGVLFSMCALGFRLYD